MILLVANVVCITAGLQKLNKIVEDLASTGAGARLSPRIAIVVKLFLQLKNILEAAQS